MNVVLCSICTQRLVFPMTLVCCSQTICMSCMQSWFTSTRESGGPFTCPLCRWGLDADMYPMQDLFDARRLALPEPSEQAEPATEDVDDNDDDVDWEPDYDGEDYEMPPVVSVVSVEPSGDTEMADLPDVREPEGVRTPTRSRSTYPPPPPPPLGRTMRRAVSHRERSILFRNGHTEIRFNF